MPNTRCLARVGWRKLRGGAHANMQIPQSGLSPEASDAPRLQSERLVFSPRPTQSAPPLRCAMRSESGRQEMRGLLTGRFSVSLLGR
jgi:hypothetical protein